MPAWSEYKEQARGRGALAMECYVSISTPTGDSMAVKAHLPDHLVYQKELEAKGSLMMAGPMSDESGELMEGVGLVVYRASSLEAARLLAEADPMHKSGARAFTLRRWLVNEGSMSLTIELSEQKIRLLD